MGQAPAGETVRRGLADRLSLQRNATAYDLSALERKKSRGRFEGCRLARPVRSEKSDDRAPRDGQGQPLQHLDGVMVDHLDVLDRKGGVCHFGLAAQPIFIQSETGSRRLVLPFAR